MTAQPARPRDLERRLRAWSLRGQPDKPRRSPPRTPVEARVLRAHHGGDLELGGDFATRAAGS